MRDLWRRAATITTVALGLALTGASGPANSAIINIAATDDVGTELTLTQGRTYRVSWIGIADGGLYDAANSNCLTGDCASGWSNAFVVRDQFFGSSDYELELFTTGTTAAPFPTYASPLLSLAAYASGDNVNSLFFRFQNGAFVPPIHFEGVIPNPWIFTADSSQTLRLLVADPDGSRLNNFGGVSLSISAVPEPSTWVMMIVGFGLLGAALRRRGSASASAHD